MLLILFGLIAIVTAEHCEYQPLIDLLTTECPRHPGNTICAYLSRKDAGTTCDTNQECKSLACGRATGDADQKTCCLEENMVTYGRHHYCNTVPEGEACISDDVCLTFYCHPQRRKCEHLRPFNAPCDDQGECGADICGHRNHHFSSEKICCQYGVTYHHNVRFCQGVVPQGEKCYDSLMCEPLARCIEEVCV